MGERVVIVGASAPLSGAIRRDLEGMGIVVDLLDGARDVLGRLVTVSPDVAVLIHEPPRSHAFDALRSIRGDRSIHELPLLVVGRDEGGELDAIVAFELGTDDYVRVSAGAREISLRARAILRRGTARPKADGPLLSAGPIDIDVSRHVVTIGGEVVDLTALEFRLLVELTRHCGRVVHRQELLERVWLLDSSIETRTVDTHVKRLREKLGEARRCLETVRGIGYRLRAAS
jgi:two-component system phosphate regulon response regulator PhoB